MRPVCNDNLHYKREADWVGHKFRSHTWRDKKLPTPMGPEAHRSVYWGSVHPLRSEGKEHTALKM